MNSISLNGKILPGDEPALLASNRSYRYGDGLFETMKVTGGQIRHAVWHFERLFSGLSQLHYEVPRLFTPALLETEILHLCKRNDCSDAARVRLSVFRGNGGLYDEGRGIQYIIECWDLPASHDQLNSNGLVIDIYPAARKSTDLFSNLKSANFLPYSMAAVYAKEHQLNDCLLLNTAERICDSTIANVFIIRNGMLQTPPLSEGCVNGIMRRYLLETLDPHDPDLKVKEEVITPEELATAEEVFLTNAIQGIRWVQSCGVHHYTNLRTASIRERLFRTKVH